MNREETCCFSGHREITPEGYPEIERRLTREVERLFACGVRNFCCGGALGFDTMAAKAVLHLRESCPQARLVLILPCRDQTKNWSSENRRVYAEILARADAVEYMAEHYTAGCMHRRNRRMVDLSSVCVCCRLRSSGGTASTVDYALRMGLSVINLAQAGPACSP